MATVIDSLVVELGMDTRKFEEGERTALVTVEEFKRRLATVGEAAQGGAEKLSNLFMVLRGGIFGFVAALGLGAIATFVERVMQMDAQTSRLAKSLSMSTRELSIWQGVLKQVGGTAESANSFFATLADSLADIRLGISMPSGPFAFVMGQMGLDIRRSTPEQIAGRIPEFVQQQRAAGRQDLDIRALLRQIPGMNDAAIFAALNGNFGAMRRAVETVGPLTGPQGEAAEKLAAKQALVETAFDRLASKGLPALEAAVEGATNALARLVEAFSGTVPSISAPRSGGTTGRPGPLSRGLRSPLERSNNNPGNIPYGTFAKQLGAIGADDQGMAVFPGPNEGARAKDNFDVLHGRRIPGPQSSLGGRGGGTTVNVAAINVTSSRADPRQVAAAIPPELQRMVMVIPHDSALTG